MAGLLDDCQTFIASVNAAGGNAQMLHFPDQGLDGNTHVMMQDKNNLQVADLILAWIDQHVEGKHGECHHRSAKVPARRLEADRGLPVGGRP